MTKQDASCMEYTPCALEVPIYWRSLVSIRSSFKSLADSIIDVVEVIVTGNGNIVTGHNVGKDVVNVDIVQCQRKNSPIITWDNLGLSLYGFQHLN